MSRFRWIGLLIGIGLFAWLLKTQDLSGVWGQVRGMQWRFVLVLLFYPVIFGLDTLGWGCALSEKERSKIRWDRLFRIRLAGEALNYVTPTASVGGEPVKAHLLYTRHGIPLADGMASVVVAKTTFSISLFFFIVIGFLMTLFTRPLNPEILRWVCIALPVFGVLLGLFLLVQFFTPFQRGAAAIRWAAPGWVKKMEAKIQAWDQTLLAVYRQSPKTVLRSFLFHFLGWVAGVFEVFLILRLLHVPVDFATAWSVESLWLLLKSASFLIPASLGASEGLSLIVCAGLGIGAVAGLALALVRRAREILWMGLGLLEFSRR